MKLISRDHIKSIINEELTKSNLFLIDLNVNKANKISVFVDSIKGVTIADCENLSRLIEKNLDRDKEDFELEVSSPGLDKPLKMPVQYQKNIGREVEVVTNGGKKIKGKIISVGTANFEIEYNIKEKPEGGNKKISVAKKEIFEFDQVKTTKVIVKY